MMFVLRSCVVAFDIFCLFWIASRVVLHCATPWPLCQFGDEHRVLWPFQRFNNACFLLRHNSAAILGTSTLNNDCLCFKQKTQQH